MKTAVGIWHSLRAKKKEAGPNYYLLAAAVRPHGVSGRRAIQFAASIDHAVWFHRPARVDEWLLYVMDSPSASSGRGFTRASIFARNGRLVASTAQESLIRVRRSGLAARRGSS